MRNIDKTMNRKRYVAPQMESVSAGHAMPLCSSGVTGNGILDGVGYGGVDTDGGKTPSAKEINEFCEELDRMGW